MFSILDWKDILRPIRDGYRHLFPSPDTGSTPDERRRQRDRDRLLRGFEYFDTIEQLEKWTQADSDPLQRANTPLLMRPSLAIMQNVQAANVLLCHDYCGNYHGYEGVHPFGVDEETYTCQWLQFIDIFIYFSHKLVCVPPPSWINSLHRNGVKVLGTLLVEPQTQSAGRLLQRDGIDADGSVQYPIAKKLALMAQHYGFDGWLVNIEKPFAKEDWDLGILIGFLRQLRNALGPNKKLIWYDSITSDNYVSYQNTLNAKNISFANACGGVLVNYSWREEQARSSFQYAHQNGLSPKDVFFGIDVWAQNKSSFVHPRKTYGGGGTCTGTAIDKLAEVGLSAGVFAPAWSFEHFPGQGHNVERHLWHGDPLSEKLICSCGDSKYHPASAGPYITQRARRFAAGSDNFFFTDFSRGFGRHDEKAAKAIYDDKMVHAQLSSLSILPHLATTVNWNHRVDNMSSVGTLTQHLEEVKDETHLVIAMHSVPPRLEPIEQQNEYSTPLFHLSMTVDTPLQLTIFCRGGVELPTATPSLYLKFTNEIRFVDVIKTEVAQSYETVIDSAEMAGFGSQLGKLEELGVRVRAPQVAQQTLRVLDIHSISITRLATETSPNQVNLHDFRMEKYQGNLEHWRLCWTFRELERSLPDFGLPRSDITGPFSYFCVKIGGIKIGRVYGLQCIVPDTLSKELGCDDGELVDIEGFGFDGKLLAQRQVRMRVDQ